MVRRRLVAAAAAVVVLAVAPRAQTQRFISEKDLFKYESSIHVVPADGSTAPRRLTSGIRDTTPRWSPDGKQIAFVRSVDKDGKPAPAQICLLAMDGGEARAITDGERGGGRAA